MTDALRSCANCGTVIDRPGGRPPRDGVWYCTAKPCIAAKARAVRAAAAPEKEQRICSVCMGAILSPGGRPPADGNWTCSNPECQAVKARSKRGVRVGVPAGKIENRPCANCGVAIPARRWRISDRPEGRWCRLSACRAAKQDVLGAVDGFFNISRIFNRLKKDRIECPVCFLPDAVPSFAHPTPDGSKPCFGLSNVAPIAEDAEYAWPHIFCETPERLAEVLRILERSAVAKW